MGVKAEKCEKDREPAPSARHLALIVTADQEEGWLLQRGLIRCGAIFATGTARNAQDALDMCRDSGYDLILLDTAVLRDESVRLIQALRQLPGKRWILLLTDLTADVQTARCCCAAGVDRIVRKPYSLLELLDRVRCLLGPSGDTRRTRLCGLLMQERGISLKLDGARYIGSAAQLLFGNGMLPMKTVYWEIATQEQTSAANVESAIRSAIRAAKASEYAGLTNKEFLYGLVEELKLYEND